MVFDQGRVARGDAPAICGGDFGRFRSEGASVGVDVVAKGLAGEVGRGRQWSRSSGAPRACGCFVGGSLVDGVRLEFERVTDRWFGL